MGNIVVDPSGHSISLPGWRLAVVSATILTPIATWVVTLPTYLAANTGGEGSGLFSAGFIGWAGATGALGALVSPLLFGVLADRWFGVHRILPVLQFLCACFLFCLIRATTQWQFFLCLLAYFIFFAPTLGLMNVICFRNLSDPMRQFPPLRALTTLSWIMGCCLVGYVAPNWWGSSIEATTIPLQMAAVLHVAVGCIALLLPPTPPDRNRSSTVRRLLGTEALSILKHPELSLPILSIALLAISMQFYQQFANVYLNRIGVVGAAGVLAWGQITELVCVLLLPVAFFRLGIRWTLTLGTGAWFVRYLLLAIAGSTPAIYWSAVLLHGVAFSFSFIALQMAVDQHAARNSRSAAQGLISVISSGMGPLVGAMLVGFCQARFLTPADVVPPPYDWHRVWWFAATFSLIPFVLLLVSKPRQAAIRPASTTELAIESAG